MALGVQETYETHPSLVTWISGLLGFACTVCSFQGEVNFAGRLVECVLEEAGLVSGALEEGVSQQPGVSDPSVWLS